MVKCIHSDVCNEYNRRFNKRLKYQCSRKCKFFQKNINQDGIYVTPKQVGNIVSDAIMDAILATRSAYDRTEYDE
jgi:hypothetical protein